jgi:hypothetical protein
MQTKLTNLTKQNLQLFLETISDSATEAMATTLKFYTDILPEVITVAATLPADKTFNVELQDRNTAVSATSLAATVPTYLAASITYDTSTTGNTTTVSHTWAVGYPSVDTYTYRSWTKVQKTFATQA